MMQWLPLLWLPETVFCILFIRAGHPVSTKKAFWLKMCASSVFLLHGILSYLAVSAQTAYGKWIVAGLALGWFGDIFLTIHPFLPPDSSRRTALLVTLPGGFAFLFGHTAYVIAFTRLQAAGVFALPLFLCFWAGFGALLMVLFRLLKVRIGRLLPLILIYASAITAMVSLACTIALRGFGVCAAQVILIAAPLLFLLSDSTLGLRLFAPDRFRSLGIRILYLAAYYIAQMLFGLSILYLQ